MISSANTALVMIDMQRGFIDSTSSLCVAGAKQTVPTCARVLEFARSINMPIYHIRRRYSFDGSDVEPVRLKIWEDGGKPLCLRGDDPKSCDAPTLLEAQSGELVLYKPRFSAFFETDFHQILQDNGITTLVLMGTTTPNCIRTTCYDGLSYNYDVIVLDDATSSRTPEVQDANIEDMRFIGATILTSDEFFKRVEADIKKLSTESV